MANYAIRTCTSCGIRKPQPEMNHVVTYVEVGKSKRTVTGSTILGLFLDDKKSAKAVRDAMFNTSQRTYKRKRKVWVCDNCKSKVEASGGGDRIGCLGWIFIIGVAIAIIASMENGESVTNDTEIGHNVDIRSSQVTRNSNTGFPEGTSDHSNADMHSDPVAHSNKSASDLITSRHDEANSQEPVRSNLLSTFKQVIDLDWERVENFEDAQSGRK